MGLSVKQIVSSLPAGRGGSPLGITPRLYLSNLESNLFLLV